MDWRRSKAGSSYAMQLQFMRSWPLANSTDGSEFQLHLSKRCIFHPSNSVHRSLHRAEDGM